MTAWTRALSKGPCLLKGGLLRPRILLWILLVPICGFGEAANSAQVLDPRAKDPLEVRADRLEYRRKEHLTIYSGNVVAKQNAYRLNCRRLEVHWNPDSGKISCLIARGDVKLHTQEGTATSGAALLDLASSAIILTESPKLVHGKESVEGQRIIYSISERKSTVMGGRKKRVKSRFMLEGSGN